MNPAENSTNNGKKVSKSTSFSCCTILQKSKRFKKHETFVLNPFEENKTVQKAWVFCAAEMVQKVWVFCATPICTKKKPVQNVSVFCAAPIITKKRFKSVSFLCCTIFQGKMVPKAWVFVLYHFAEKKRFKKHEFFVPHHFVEKNKRFKMWEFFLCRTI